MPEPLAQRGSSISFGHRSFKRAKRFSQRANVVIIHAQCSQNSEEIDVFMVHPTYQPKMGQPLINFVESVSIEGKRESKTKV